MTQTDYLTVSVVWGFWHHLSWTFHSVSHKAIIKVAASCILIWRVIWGRICFQAPTDSTLQCVCLRHTLAQLQLYVWGP